MPDYTVYETTVLDYFFTNTGDNTYAVKDTVPMSLWGFLAGGASRSSLGIRDRFLQIFKDMADKLTPEEAEVLSSATTDLIMRSATGDICSHLIDLLTHVVENTASAEERREYDGLCGTLYACYMYLLSTSIKTGKSLDLSKAIARACKFMETYAINYGHNSLKDSCVDRIAFDKISIRAAKLLEDSSLGAFQEKSTRYMDFETASVIVPANMNDVDTELYHSIIESGRVLYKDVKDAAFAHYKSTLNPEEFKTTVALERTAMAKAFDTARYCLLVGYPTTVATTMTSRETERHFAGLQAHPNSEIRGLASKAVCEAQLINPGLLTHVQPNSYRYGVETDIESFIQNNPLPYNKQRICDSALKQYRYAGVRDVRTNVLLSHQTPEIVHTLAASVYASSKPSGYMFGHVLDNLLIKNDYDYSLRIIEAALSNRSGHDELPKSFGVGQFFFNVLIDYGAFRDLQRHRVGTQFVGKLNTDFGYCVPKLLFTSGFETVLERYRDYMESVNIAQQQVIARSDISNSDVSEYFFALGHIVSFTYICDFRQLVYLTELRSTPQAHESYRAVAQEMWSQAIEALFKTIVNTDVDDEYSAVKYKERFNAMFRVNMDDYGDRRNEEARS